MAKKLRKPAVNSCTAGSNYKLLTIPCKINKMKFLIDTGSIVSIIPSKNFRNLPEQDGTLLAANLSKIPTYGTQALKVDLGLGSKMSWEFIIADINQPIIGVDFLTHHSISVDVSNKQIRLGQSNATARGVAENSEIHSVTIATDPRAQKLLNKYPALVEIPEVLPKPTHNHVHRIPIKSDSKMPFCRPRNLPVKQLKELRTQFEIMERRGIISRARSSCVSPIHMVEKKDSPDSPYRIVADLRQVNKMVEKDGYPIPFLQNFTTELFEKKPSQN